MSEKSEKKCCIHDHEHDHKHEACKCGHHHDHEHEACKCGHHHEHEACECGHDHEYEHEHEACECGHDHEHEHEACGCGHDHEHGEENSSFCRRLIKYTVGGLPVICAFLPFIPTHVRVICALIAYGIFGFEVWRDMIKGFCKRRIFTEFTLMCVASVGAFAIGEFADGAAVVYLYSLGEMLSDSAYARSKKNISSLLEITPEYATVIRRGESLRVSPEDVDVGEIFIAVSGERVALDAVVCEGSADADTSSVTGEAIPLSLYEGVACPSGAVILNGSVKLRATQSFENSVVSKLTRAVKEASKRKAAAEKKISSFARAFTPVAFGTAVAIALVGSLVTRDAGTWVKAGLTVLVVSCPCSLLLSVPLTYFAGIGSAASRGIVFRGGEVMEGLCRVSAAAFDKTGTLTEAKASFEGVQAFNGIDEEELLSVARDALSFSPHAAAVSFCEAYSSPNAHKIENAENIGGRGLVCTVDGRRALFGNAALMRENGIEAEDSKKTAIFVAVDGRLWGKLNFSSKLKSGSAEAVQALKALGIGRMAIISGDGEDAVRETSDSLEISEYYWSVAPHEKAELLCKIQNEQKQVSNRSKVAYLGDGLNDSAVIAMADVGIAMGDNSAALTAESADIVLMDGNIGKLSEAIRISKRTSRIATQNIVISIGIKLAVMAVGVVLSVYGKNMPLELAIVADVGAAVIAVLNAMRAAERKKNNGKKE